MATLPPKEMEYMLAHAHDNRGPVATKSVSVCLGLALIAVTLRVIARRASKAPLKADDYWIFISLVIAIAEAIVSIYGVHFGAGRHIIFIKSPQDLAEIILASEALYFVGATTFKFSVLCFFVRMFGSNKRFAMICWGVGIFALATNTTQFILTFTQCVPLRKMWNPTVPGSCLNSVVWISILGAINTLLDVIIVALPMPLIWGLHMQTKRKIQVAGIFLLSGFVCVASVIRITTLRKMNDVDASWNDVDAGIWAEGEICIGIVSACLPTMRPIFNLIVRGHHCSARDVHCSRCENSRASGGRWKSQTRRLGSKSSPSGAYVLREGKPAIVSTDVESNAGKHEPKVTSSSVSSSME